MQHREFPVGPPSSSVVEWTGSQRSAQLVGRLVVRAFVSRRWQVSTGLLGVLAVVLFGGVVARAATTMSWARPVRIDRAGRPAGVVCPSVALCIAYDDSGNLVVSSRPAGGASAWKVRKIDRSSRALRGVVCASRLLCAAYDSVGNVFVSTHPGGGAHRWVRRAVDQHGLDSVSCPSVSLCVGVDQAGNAITSTEPARAGSWRMFALGDNSPTYECVHYQDCGMRSLSDISCASASLCLALDQAGNVVASAHPSRGAGGWHVVFAETPDSGSGLQSIACASASFCAGVDGWGNFVASQDPTAGQSAWRATGIGTGGQPLWLVPNAGSENVLTAVACRSATLCVGTNGDGAVITTTRPRSGNPAWSLTGPRRRALLVTCATVLWCFALDQRGDIFSSLKPARGARHWARAHPDGALSHMSGPVSQTLFSCPATRLCLTVDRVGKALVGKS